MTDIETMAKGLTGAQRDIMLGHLVEIPPEEASALEEMGLKLQSRTEKVLVKRIVWPITKKGLAVRDYLKGEK